MYQAPTHYSTSLSFYLSTHQSVDNYDGNLQGIDEINDQKELSQSIPSFNTANLRSEPSFTSINNSILDDSILENDAKVDEIDDDYDYDNDKTPKLNLEGYLDKNNDNVNNDAIYKDELSIENGSSLRITNGNDDDDFDNQDTSAIKNSPHLPLHELSSEFHRLSVTLQQSKTSGHSHEFMNLFQNNVKASDDTLISKSIRSSYYKKINEKEKPVPNSDIDESSQSSVNSKITEEEIPIRKDLVEKYEQLSTMKDSNMSSKQKNDIYIESTQGNQLNLSDKLPHGLNISTTNTAKIANSVDLEFDENDLSSLFVRALHSFDSTSLQSESDASICLSFNKDDLAFVHLIDDSGWGEVTLVESLSRGWIPMNYFSIAVASDKPNLDDEDEESTGLISNSQYLQPLFHSCGKFLINPLSHKNKNGEYTFSIKTINSIRDGVRLLLQYTDCLSRSNEIVTKRPLVRKSRKSLLADWYNLMVKANEFKGTTDFDKIEVLTLMVYQVTTKSTVFLQLWSIESKQVIKRETERKLQNDMNNYPLLPTPPLARSRITEINGLLFTYLSIIIGRLDLVEHNRIGCEMLENLTHQIILLLRELLFISRTGSELSKEKPYDLDASLDTLLSLVSDLVIGVKACVLKTVQEDTTLSTPILGDSNDYYYTPEGGNLIQVASKIIRSVSKTITSIFKLLEVTGDFKLNSERSYPDYSKMKIEPDVFIRNCTLGLAKSNSIENSEAFKTYKPAEPMNRNRYSMIRTGKTGELGITPTGVNILQNVLITQEGSSPFSVSNAEFQRFNNEDNSVETDIKNELLVDNHGNLLGASFKGLVYTLTNENSPPDYFFVSTFFICYRSFASALDLTEELITRFDIPNKFAGGQTKDDISLEVKIKNRRRLIVKMFQLWMESYWSQEKDNGILTTFINFFNEGVTLYLPIEATKLIEIAVRLSTKPLIENEVREIKPFKQLVTRSITATKANRKNSFTDLDQQFSSRYSMVDGYELSKINTNSSSSSLRSMTLPMPLGVGNQTSNSNALLSRNQLSTIEKVNLTYRAILGTSWCAQEFVSSKRYQPLELPSILANWFNICDQSWVLSNYRPNLLDFNGLEIAKQLTLIESHIFCSINPDELLNENFTSKRAYLKLAPNVRLSLLFTNCLSEYVLESSLHPEINQKTRVSMIKTWLKIAISCLYLRNFNSLAAIITALQSHLITRLDKVWSDLSPKYRELYDYLSGIIHPEKNYLIYRTKLRNFLIANDYNVPIVPYFSLFLQDLTFLTDGNPNYRKANTFLNQKLINIDKYLKITRIIADIESLQIPYINNKENVVVNKRYSILSIGSLKSDTEDYSIIPVPALQELILLELWKVCQLNKHEEDRAWKLSLIIQPR